MSDVRLFDEDPLFGTRTWFVPLNEEGDFQLVTQQDHEPFMQDALDRRNAHDEKGTQKWKGDMHHIGYIPMPVWSQMMRDGRAFEQKELKKWLNDPANQMFRTKRGKV